MICRTVPSNIDLPWSRQLMIMVYQSEGCLIAKIIKEIEALKDLFDDDDDCKGRPCCKGGNHCG